MRPFCLARGVYACASDEGAVCFENPSFEGRPLRNETGAGARTLLLQHISGMPVLDEAGFDVLLERGPEAAREAAQTSDE